MTIEDDIAFLERVPIFRRLGAGGLRILAIGTFADPSFPAPTIAVWEASRHPWVSLPPDTPPKRFAKQG